MTIETRREPRYPAIGLPPVSTSRALAVPQGWNWTVTGPPAAVLPEKPAAAPELVIWVEKIDGQLGVRIEPMELKPAALHRARGAERAFKTTMLMAREKCRRG